MWCVILYFDFSWILLCRPSMKEYVFSVASDFCLLTTRTLAFRTSCFWVPPSFQYDPFFLWLFHCSSSMHPVFSNLHEHFLLRSIAFWFFEADAVLCAPSFQLDIFQVLWFWCVFQYFDCWWMWCAAPVRWNMLLWCSWLLDLRTNPTFCILEGCVFECLFASTKNYFAFFRNWCSTGSVYYTLSFLFYLIISFSQQFIVFVFGSWCCFGFSIFLLWFIPSLVNVMCYTVLWFFMNVMLCRPSMKEYDFSVASDFVLLTTRTLWLFELYAFGFLLPSNMIHFFVAVSLLLFDAPCFFQSPWTLSAQEYSVLVFWSWCCFVCSIIPTWYISSLVILTRLPILRLLMNVMCRPSKMEYAFMMQLITRSAHKSNVLHFGRLCFWVPVCFNQELLRFFSELMFYWFSVLHLVFPFLLDN